MSINGLYDQSGHAIHISVSSAVTRLATTERSPPRRQPKNALEYDQLAIRRVFSRSATFPRRPLRSAPRGWRFRSNPGRRTADRPADELAIHYQ